MHRLILVSTELEIRPLVDRLVPEKRSYGFSLIEGPEFTQILIGGIGIVSTLMELHSYCWSQKPDVIVQVGFAGSYDPDLMPGTMVEVNRDCFADLGFDDNGHFVPLSKEFPSDRGNYGVLEYEAQTDLQTKMGITVQTTSGSEQRISDMVKWWKPDVETMEGAAGMLFCKKNNIPYLQVRAISNRVEPRNKSGWKPQLASEKLCLWIFKYLESFL